MGIELALNLLGGPTLFVYGTQMMSTNLEAMARSRMKQILEYLTANRFLGVLMGAGVTASIQSSSAATVMIVGFVNSGLMTPKQAVRVIMGINVDTTTTGQLTTLDIGALAPLTAFVGVTFLIFTKDKEVQHVGGIITGISILFVGVGMMNDVMAPLRDPETLTYMVTKFSNPFLEILVGAIFTVTIQPSSASVSIFQALAIGGAINPHSAALVLFGQNIGTCITTLLASMGTSRSAERTTLIHLMLNVIGTALFVILCILAPSTDFVVSSTSNNPAAQIANVHTIFNISAALTLLLPGALLGKAAAATLSDKAVPVKDADQWFGEFMVPEHHLGISTIVISQARDEVKGMLTTAVENTSQSFKTMEEGASEGIQVIVDREEEINLSSMKLFQKISKILVPDQMPKDIDTLNRMYTILGNIERISDHATSLVEYVEIIEAKGLQFSNYARKEFATMEETCREGMKLLEVVATRDAQSPLLEVAEIEQRIDDITCKFRQNQIGRMREGNCNVESSILYSEMLTDYE